MSRVILSLMDSKRSDDQFTDEEIARRRDDVIRRMANTPPKPHSAMKIGKGKVKAGAKASRFGKDGR